MSHPIKVLAVPNDAVIDSNSMKKLNSYGVVLVRSATPEAVRLATPVEDIDLLPANEFMWAALDALNTGKDDSYSEATKQRRKFVENLAGIADRKRRKLIGWSAEVPDK